MTAYRLTTALGKKMAKQEAAKHAKLAAKNAVTGVMKTGYMLYSEEVAKDLPGLKPKEIKKAISKRWQALSKERKQSYIDKEGIVPGMSIKLVCQKSDLKKPIDWSTSIDVNKSFIEQKYVSGEAYKSAFAAFKKYSKPVSNKWESVVASVLGNAYSQSTAYAMRHMHEKGRRRAPRTP